MNVSRTLSSVVAAATIVGAVGIAYAQTAAPEGGTAMQPNAAARVTPSSAQNNAPVLTTPSTSSSTSTSTDAPSTDLAPRADRN